MLPLFKSQLCLPISNAWVAWYFPRWLGNRFGIFYLNYEVNNCVFGKNKHKRGTLLYQSRIRKALHSAFSNYCNVNGSPITAERVFMKCFNFETLRKKISIWSVAHLDLLSIILLQEKRCFETRQNAVPSCILSWNGFHSSQLSAAG